VQGSILHALASSTRFGIITSGADMVPGIDFGVLAYLGGLSARYVGCIATGLGVVELQTGDRAHVENRMKHTSGEIARRGADVIILGCAGWL
jgi:Asp/Glu/hydantoin racemase